MIELLDNVKSLSDTSIVWRYMKFKRLKSMLNNKELYISNITDFDDKFEGSIPKANARKRDEIIRRNFKENKKFYRNVESNIGRKLSIPYNDIDKFIKWVKETNEQLRNDIVVSCWYLMEYESLAMWKIYGHDENCVAIQTTFGKIKSLLEGNMNHVFIIGKIKYIDYQKGDYDLVDELQEENKTYIPYFHKYQSYDFERELRILVFNQFQGKR